MAFGERLQAVRRRNGLTQEEVAAQLKVSRQAVSKWESCRGYPEMEKIIYICNRYGVTMDELFADEVPTGAREEPPAVAERMPDRPLKRVLADFFANLSPVNQLMIGGLLAALALLVLLVSHHLKGGTDHMMTIVWTAAIILFGVVEAVTAGLVSIWFVAGSLAALVAAFVDAPLAVQIVLFLVVSFVALLLARPLARKFLTPGYQPTNADRILGTEAVVTEAIDNLNGRGLVSVGGSVWTARAQDDQPIAAGTVVRILRIEGVKVFVTPAEVGSATK